MTISDPKKFCASARSRTPASCYPGKHHTARLPRHLITVTFTPPRRNHVLICLELRDNTLATKCNSGLKWQLAIWKKFCASARIQTLASHYLGEYHTARLPRHLIAVTIQTMDSMATKDLLTWTLVLVTSTATKISMMRSFWHCCWRTLWMDLYIISILCSIENYPFHVVMQFIVLKSGQFKLFFKGSWTLSQIGFGN